MPPKISVVLLNWNNAQETLNCISQLRSINYPQDKIHIIVVDNGSTDNSIELLTQSLDISLIKLPSNIGFAAGTNAGIQSALLGDCEYVLILNNDTVLPVNFLNPLVEMIETQASIGVIAPKINYADHQDIIWFAGGKFSKPRILGSLIGINEVDQKQYDIPKIIDFAVGCCMLVRRIVFEKVGFFDEDFFFYHEDVDFCYRVQQSGFLIYYQPKSIIYHKVALSTSMDIPRRIYLQNQARMIFFAKHIRGISTLIVVFLEFARFFRTITSYLLTRKFEMIKPYLQGIWTGLIKSFQIILYPRDSRTGKQSSNQILQKNWRLTFRIVGSIFFISILTFLCVRAVNGIKEIISSGVKLHLEYLVISFFCQFIGVLIAALVWSDILRQLGVKSSYLFDLQAFAASALTRKIPGFVVYAISRILIYDYIKASKIRVTIAMVVEMVMMSLAGLVCISSSVGNTLLPEYLTKNEWLFAILILVFVILACLLSPYLIRFLLKFASSDDKNELDSFKQPVKFRDTLRWMLGEVIVILLASGVVFFTTRAVSTSSVVHYTSILGAVSLTVTIGPLAVWMPGDIGLRDGFLYLATRSALGSSIAALVTLLARIWVSLLEILFGVIAFLALSRSINLQKKRND